MFKYTTIAGYNKEGEFVVKGRNGFWKEDTVRKVAEKYNMRGDIKITHALLGGKPWQNGHVHKFIITI